MGQQLVVEERFLLVEGETEYPRAATLALHGALRVGGGVGKVLVVEHVVGIEREGVRLHAFERRAFVFLVVNAVETVHALQLEGARVADIHEVHAEHRTIQTQAQLRGLSGVFRVAEVEGIAHENPTPAHVRPNLERWGGRERDALFFTRGVLCGDAVLLHEVRVLHHGRKVVVIGRDVIRVVFVEIFEEAFEEAARVLHLFLAHVAAREGVGRRGNTIGLRHGRGGEE